MDTEVLIGLIGAFSTIASSVATFVFTKRKYNAEVDNNLIENMKKSLEFYEQLSDDNKQRLDMALQRSEQLEGEVKELRKQVLNLMGMVCTDLSCQLRKSKGRGVPRGDLHMKGQERKEAEK